MALAWPGWIGVVAEDLEKQRAFYREARRFRDTAASGGWVHLEVPGGGLFELIRREPLPQYDAERYQVGFTVNDIRAARAELIRRGVEPISEIDGEESGSSNLWCTSGTRGQRFRDHAVAIAIASHRGGGRESNPPASFRPLTGFEDRRGLSGQNAVGGP